MIGYASRTGTRRNLDALRSASWRLLISREGAWRTEGFPYALDNGAWSDYQRRQDFDNERFKALVDRFGAEADWVVSPDIVAGGLSSLRLSVCWLASLMTRCRLVLIAVQDGMEPKDIAGIVMPRRVGVFLGGSTSWKLKTMSEWGDFCAERGVYYHVARANSFKRIQAARSSGADSIDGSSASRYAVTLPALNHALNHESPQWNLWMPPVSREARLAWLRDVSPDVDGRGERLALGQPVNAR